MYEFDVGTPAPHSQVAGQSPIYHPEPVTASVISSEERQMWVEVQQLNSVLLNQNALQNMIREEEMLHDLLDKTLIPKVTSAYTAPGTAGGHSSAAMYGTTQYAAGGGASPHHQQQHQSAKSAGSQESVLLLMEQLTRNLQDSEVRLQSRIRTLEQERRMISKDQNPSPMRGEAYLDASPSPSAFPTEADALTKSDEEIQADLTAARTEVEHWSSEKQELLEKVAKLEAKCAKLSQVVDSAEDAREKARLASRNSKKAFGGFSLQNNTTAGSNALQDLMVVGAGQTALDVWVGGGAQNTSTRACDDDTYSDVASYSDAGGSHRTSSALSGAAAAQLGIVNVRGLNLLEAEVKEVDQEIARYGRLCQTTHCILAVPKIIPSKKR